MKKKILHIAWGGKLDPAEGAIAAILDGQGQTAATHALCLFSTGEGFTLPEEPSHVAEIYRIGMDNPWQLFKAHSVVDIVARSHADILHLHGPVMPFMLQAPRFEAMPLFYSDDGNALNPSTMPWWEKLFWHVKGSSWRGIFFHDPETMNAFLKSFPALGDKLHLLESDAPSSRNAALETAYGIAPDGLQEPGL